LLNENIAKVFPLFGPVREMDWASGWSPEILYGHSEVEEHMIFRTRAQEHDEDYYRWVVTKYIPPQHEIEYMVSAAERVWFIKVECRSDENFTLATITYVYIGLTKKGHVRNRHALDKMFKDNLADWENAINHYLRTGQKLRT
jgi:hypothetical protein